MPEEKDESQNKLLTVKYVALAKNRQIPPSMVGSRNIIGTHILQKHKNTTSIVSMVLPERQK